MVYLLNADIDAGTKVVFPVENKSDLEVIEQKIESKNTQIVHGNNSSVPEIKNFIRDIDKLYTQYKNLGYTSTIGTGVDLSTPHFEKRYAILTGDVLTANDHCQLLARYRPDVETSIYIDDTIQTLEIDADQILAKLAQKNTESGKLMATNINYLIQEGLYPAPNGEIRDEDRAYLKLWATLKARRNASLANPKQTLCDRLRESGYTLEILEDSKTEETENIEQNHKDAKKENRELEDEAIASTEVCFCQSKNYKKYKNSPPSAVGHL
ncbi:hypothetical protein F7734_11435 [Scytonema sp. UIC 10036]|uniref:hypothetical protein n=1 Tax=Scytonema sp. UIC 10036 TaxID=2304196 RepID=UPI0012DA6B0E|nr:hypothetical protein [Scytonema sp. UIC 10036]MUG93016.1 hypothetical protein [Scytonema sp. UIC 10036]